MREILGQRPLRFVFAANVISMLGSGMNSAAVAWYILQATHSEMALGTFAVLQTVPAMLMLPFTGVIIDREDRRRLVMWLDAVRAVIIVTVAILAFQHRAQVWQLYLMNTLVAAGFWMFWPTITALIQELTPEGQFVQSNTFLLAGVQGGWLIAGAIVGFMYDHIGLGGVLLIDVSTYVVSFLCYFAVRKGRHVVLRPEELRADILAAESQFERFWREMREGLHFLRDHRAVVMLGISWALFLGAMITGVVVTPSLSDRIFHAGAKGYGWLNAGWGTGAFISALYAPQAIALLGGRRAIAFSMALLSVCVVCAPISPFLFLAISLYFLMGSARGLSGVAMNTSLMEMVPNHLMGRVQNAFYFAGTFLQLALALCVGAVAHKVSLVAAFAILACVYGMAFVAASWPVGAVVAKEEIAAD
ncbi:MAG TPA: MFS transporter [Candidatus Sulfotelmatobacter sp.]|jgi:MFS family permease|nr:MFS transporter [Candidatus Sulfotelmatobacter sp.]